MRHTSCIFCLHLNCTASFYQKCLSTKNQFKNQNLKCKCNSKTRHIFFPQPIPFMSHLKTDFWSNKNRCYFSNSDKCFFLQERACHKNWISSKWCQWHTRIPSVTPEMRVMNFPSSKKSWLDDIQNYKSCYWFAFLWLLFKGWECEMCEASKVTSKTSVLSLSF